MAPAQEDLPEISAKLEGRSPQEILTWAAETYGDKLAMATAFQAQGCALIAMLSEISKDIYLFSIDTGYLFPETLELRERLMEKYGVYIHLAQARESVREMEERFEGPLYDRDPDRCCHIRKVAPLAGAVEGYEAWISSIRRDQSAARANAPIVGWDRKFHLAKVNPLANWTKKDVWDYILKNDVPYNPLHDQGYPSIGCWPCTRAVGEGQEERSGRWVGFAKVECGLHVVNS